MTDVSLFSALVRWLSFEELPPTQSIKMHAILIIMLFLASVHKQSTTNGSNDEWFPWLRCLRLVGNHGSAVVLLPHKRVSAHLIHFAANYRTALIC